MPIEHVANWATDAADVAELDLRVLPDEVPTTRTIVISGPGLRSACVDGQQTSLVDDSLNSGDMYVAFWFRIDAPVPLETLHAPPWRPWAPCIQKLQCTNRTTCLESPFEATLEFNISSDRIRCSLVNVTLQDEDAGSIGGLFSDDEDISQ